MISCAGKNQEYEMVWIQDKKADQPVSLFPDADSLFLDSLGIDGAVPSSINVFLAEKDGKVMLFDAGLGLPGSGLMMALDSLGISPSEVDYVFLTHLHEIIVDFQQNVLGDIALQAHRTVAPGGYHCPYARLMVVVKHANIAYLDKAEVYGVGVKQQLSTVLFHRSVLHVAVFAVLTVGIKPLHYSVKLALVDWFQQEIESRGPQCIEHVFVECAVKHDMHVCVDGGTKVVQQFKPAFS